MLMILGIPIIAILTAHQRKMAELMHSRGQEQNNPQLAYELQMLRDEVRGLRDQVNQQALAVDSFRNATPAVAEQNLQVRQNPPAF
ncbi:MAG: hypothetical protein K8R88_00880 [Armatimonadetes bacterium]|nr:hypothetical protein [Armatimonadota bacterium]